MKINTDSWHYRFNSWAWGKVPNSLCPYVDKLIFGLILSPFIAGWRVLSKNGKSVAVLTTIGLFYGTLFSFILGWWGLLAGQVLVWGLAGGVYGAVNLVESIEWRFPSWHFPKLWHRVKKEKPPKVKKPREPSLLAEWLKAKHRKICPYLEFVPE